MHSNKRRSKKCYVIKSEKYITPMDFAEHLRKSELSENNKVYNGKFLRYGLMKGIIILVKVDEMSNIVKSASHCLLVER